MVKRRLYQVLRAAGIGNTIRETKNIITSQKVAIDGIICTRSDFQLEADRHVTVDGQSIASKEKAYFLLHKPAGYSCQKNEKTPFVGDLIPVPGLSPVGRLDFDTTGLLIMTNDGELSAKITSPESKIQKTYVSTLNKPISVADIEKLKAGVSIPVEGAVYQTQPCKIKKMSETKIEISIHEGKKRQVRLMFNALGYEVRELQRIGIGKITLGNLKEGEYRQVSKEEILSALK